MNDKQAKLARFLSKHISYETIKKDLNPEEQEKLTFELLPIALYTNKRTVRGTVIHYTRYLTKPSVRYYYKLLKKFYKKTGKFESKSIA